MELKFTVQLNYVLLPAGVLVGAIMAVGLTSMADGPELDTDPRVVPYNGVLEFNGEALNGQADLEFTLTDVPGGEGANCAFSEEHDNVTAYAGRFSVNICSVAGDLPDCVFDSTAMYIEVGVRDAESDGDYVALSGSQRIHPVPFSYWAAEGSDFKVDGDATIGGSVALGDSSALGDAALYVAQQVSDQPVFWAGQFTVDSEDGSGLINIVAGAHATTNNNHAFNDTRGASRIRLGDGDITFYGGPTEGTADGTVSWTELLDLDSDGSMNASGNIQSAGNITAGSDGSGNLYANGNVGLEGLLYAGGGSDTLTIDDNVDVNDGLQVGADGSGSLNVAGNGTIGSDGSGDLTVNGDITLTGNINGILEEADYQQGNTLNRYPNDVILTTRSDHVCFITQTPEDVSCLIAGGVMSGGVEYWAMVCQSADPFESGTSRAVCLSK